MKVGNSIVSTVREVRFLTDNTFIIRFDRNNMPFHAGQYVSVGLKGLDQRREYSIYSGESDDYLEILVREVLDGNVSLKLKDCRPGDELLVKGPMGGLKLREDDRFEKKLVFIASGTGIAPFHSFLKSYPGIDYRLIHGVRYGEEAYEKDHYDLTRYVLCTTGDNKGNYNGRVTEYLQEKRSDPDERYYICGNSRMIYSVYDILSKRGIPAEHISLEVYF
ncbi:MAG: ferredoxin--NADP reductase [Bacteroidota bacterium]